ncbi:MAG: hypothetical protein ABSA54_00470 [Terriglobales bacterium]
MAFWEAGGQICTFPRDIEAAIAWALPLAILRIPNLWISDVEASFRQRRLPFVAQAEDRPLHGCIFAYAGKGLIIVDGSDATHELRFTIAHEVSHFLLDYHEPRQRAIKKLGVSITTVLDGLRAATTEERVDAILAAVTIGMYSHFMHRDSESGTGSIVSHSESQANGLAIELLAPEENLWRALPRDLGERPFSKRVASVSGILVRRFGLPPSIARSHAARLCRSWFGGPSVRDRLGLRK